MNIFKRLSRPFHRHKYYWVEAIHTDYGTINKYYCLYTFCSKSKIEIAMSEKECERRKKKLK